MTDGEYLIWAQLTASSNEPLVSEPKRITVKGADVTGIEVTAKPPQTVGLVAPLPSMKDIDTTAPLAVDLQSPKEHRY